MQTVKVRPTVKNNKETKSHRGAKDVTIQPRMCSIHFVKVPGAVCCKSVLICTMQRSLLHPALRLHKVLSQFSNADKVLGSSN